MPDRPERPMLDPAVRADFRRRAITTAMAELCAQQGYLATSVADVAGRAAMSRSTVYSLYPNREAILVDLIDRTGADLLARGEAACGGAAADLGERIRPGLRAILARIGEEPARARVFLLDAPRVSAQSMDRHQTAMSGLATLLAAAVPDNDARALRLEEIIVAGLAAVLARVAREGRLDQAPAFLEDFVGLASAPYQRRPRGWP